MCVDTSHLLFAGTLTRLLLCETVAVDIITLREADLRCNLKMHACLANCVNDDADSKLRPSLYLCVRPSPSVTYCWITTFRVAASTCQNWTNPNTATPRTRHCGNCTCCRYAQTHMHGYLLHRHSSSDTSIPCATETLPPSGAEDGTAPEPRSSE